jgi:glucosylceramidase
MPWPTTRFFKEEDEMATSIQWFETTEAHGWRQRSAPQAAAPGDSLALTGAQDQTVLGFGGCFNELSWIALQRLSEDQRQEVLDLLFAPQADGLRLNFCRMPIGASDYGAKWYSHNETPGDYAMASFSIDGDRENLLPYMREAYRRNPGIKLFASPWSPPTWMKNPPVYNYGRLIWTEENLAAYALYFARFVEAYAQEGIHVDQIHPQNEPVADQKFPSCLWTGRQYAEFIGKYLGPLFAQRGLDTEIFLGTINAPDRAACPSSGTPNSRPTTPAITTMPITS